MQGFENEYTDVVQNADGSYTAEIHSVPINFRNARGAWQTIDPTLVSVPGGFRNSAGPYSVSFAGPGAPPSQVASPLVVYEPVEVVSAVAVEREP